VSRERGPRDVAIPHPRHGEDVKFEDLLADRAGVRDGLKQGLLVGAAVLALTLQPSGPRTAHLTADRAPAAATSGSFESSPRLAVFGDVTPSDDARRIADAVATSRDNRAKTFAILDKRGAQLYVFDAGAKLVGASRVLLGAAPGDDSVAGIGQRPMDQVRPEEKTTPAGRFVSHPGRNASGEEVIWVDYGAAVSMHRVRIVDPKERRLERLASGAAGDRRISYGCINIPVEFFDAVMKPLLGSSPAIVYVLPERKTLAQVFPALTAARNSPVHQERRADL
jgi:hypothetical protein